MITVKRTSDSVIEVRCTMMSANKTKEHLIKIDTDNWVKSYVYVNHKGEDTKDVTFRQKMTESDIQWCKDHYLNKLDK
jgi:hypothetical protein